MRSKMHSKRGAGTDTAAHNGKLRRQKVVRLLKFHDQFLKKKEDAEKILNNRDIFDQQVADDCKTGLVRLLKEGRSWAFISLTCPYNRLPSYLVDSEPLRLYVFFHAVSELNDLCRVWNVEPPNIQWYSRVNPTSYINMLLELVMGMKSEASVHLVYYVFMDDPRFWMLFGQSCVFTQSRLERRLQKSISRHTEAAAKYKASAFLVDRRLVNHRAIDSSTVAKMCECEPTRVERAKAVVDTLDSGDTVFPDPVLREISSYVTPALKREGARQQPGDYQTYLAHVDLLTSSGVSRVPSFDKWFEERNPDARYTCYNCAWSAVAQFEVIDK